MKVEIVYAVAIPVGHRVAVRWYRGKSKGLFGGDNEESRPHEPVVEDLDTGIVYSPEWVLETAAARYPGTPFGVSDGLKKGIEETGTLVGRVAVCRIVTGHGSDYHAQTELTIDPEPEPEGYR